MSMFYSKTGAGHTTLISVVKVCLCSSSSVVIAQLITNAAVNGLEAAPSAASLAAVIYSIWQTRTPTSSGDEVMLYVTSY